MIAIFSKIKKHMLNTGYLFLGKCFRVIVVLFVWIRAYKFLGPEQFGVFSFVTSLVLLVKPIANFGLGSVVIKRLVENPDDKEKIIGSSFILQSVGTVISLLLLFIVVSVLSLDSQLQLIVFCLSFRLIFQLLSNIIDYYFQSKVLSKYVALSQGVADAVSAVLCFLFIFLQLPLIYFVLIIVLESVITSILMVFFYCRCGYKILAWRVSWHQIIGLAKEAWPLLIICGSVAIYEKIDQVMIRQMIGDAPLGFYAAGVKVAEVFYFIPVIVVGSLFPAIVSSKMFNDSIYKARLQSLSCFLFLIAVSISTILTLFSSSIIGFLYGEAFAPAASILVLYAWTTVFVFWGYLRSRWAINEGLQIYIMAYVIIGAVLNFVLNLILLPKYSIQGAAYATLISHFVTVIMCSGLFRPTRVILKLQFGSMNIFQLIKNNVFKEASKGR